MKAAMTALGALGFTLLLAGASLAQGPDTPASERITGKPARDPKISLSLKEGTAGSAIDAIAERARWSFSAGGEGMGARVSLRMKDRPATEILARVLEVANLNARFEPGDTLVVLTAEPPAVPVAAGAPVLEEVEVDQDREDRQDRKDRGRDDRRDEEPRRGRRGSDRTAVGEDLVVAVGEEVHDAVATAGSVRVLGHVTGDAVAVGGSVTVESGARVDGDAAAIGGTVEIRPGGSVGGERTSVGGPLGKVITSAIKLSPKQGHHSGGDRGDDGWDFGGLWWTLPFFVLGFLMMLFVPDRLLTLRQALASRPWPAVAAGVGSWFGIVALSILLAVTIIGLPLVPLAIVFYLGLGLFGLTSLAWWTGSKLSFIPGTSRPLVAFTLGTLVLALVSAIPVVGVITVVLATTVSGGAALLLVLANLRRRRRGGDEPPTDDAALAT
jgi:hypothetical protein